jgi:hypothetical protein
MEFGSQFRTAAVCGDIPALVASYDPDVVNSANVDGLTALHLAARRGHVAVVNIMVQWRCLVDVVDRWGATPLCHAIHHPVVVKLLLEAKASPSCALDLALGGRGCLASAKILMDTGAGKAGRKLPRWAVQYRTQLANCKCASVAVLRCFKLIGLKDLGPTVQALVWISRADSRWDLRSANQIETEREAPDDLGTGREDEEWESENESESS